MRLAVISIRVQGELFYFAASFDDNIKGAVVTYPQVFNSETEAWFWIDAHQEMECVPANRNMQ